MSPRRVRIPRMLEPKDQAERLRRLRVAAGKLSKKDRTPYSTTEMGKLLGIGQTKYSYYETRISRPSNAVLAALRDQFDVTADWVLLGDEDNMPQYFLDEIKAVTDDELRSVSKKRD